MRTHHQTSPHTHMTMPSGYTPVSLESHTRKSIHIPPTEISRFWMQKERQRLKYASSDFQYENRVAYVRLDNPEPNELFNQYQIYETIVGEMIYKYFLKYDPEVSVHIASAHDDIFSGSDFIVCKGDSCVRIDLTTGFARLRSFEENISLITIGDKVNNFYHEPGIPYEFFATIKPHLTPGPLPLIILRIDRSILSIFIRDFFEILAQENMQVDILAYFGVWIDKNMDIIEERVAYILGLTSSKNEYNNVEKFATQIGILFAGINNVEVNYTP